MYEVADRRALCCCEVWLQESVLYIGCLLWWSVLGCICSAIVGVCILVLWRQLSEEVSMLIAFPIPPRPIYTTNTEVCLTNGFGHCVSVGWYALHCLHKCILYIIEWMLPYIIRYVWHLRTRTVIVGFITVRIIALLVQVISVSLGNTYQISYNLRQYLTKQSFV